jgi:hypothetical protein
MGVWADTVLMQTPNGNGRLELVKFHAPSRTPFRPVPK